MAKPARLDTELVRRGHAGSREEARRLIEAGGVSVNGIPAGRPATLVDPQAPIELSRSPRAFVSRGGEKLAAVLDRFDVKVEGRRWLDAGASTGGFTDALLKRGATGVAAVDVGYGQIHWTLRTDPKVRVIDRLNVRYLEPGQLPWPPEGVVADLSFISLTLVLPALDSVARQDADFVLLVKPQFEAGREAVGKRGVVRDPNTWHAAVEKVVSRGRELGLGLVDAAPSPVVGAAGNHEFFVHLRRGATTNEFAIAAAIEAAT
jgi:23S rRNA (cytidine1920-2'-O)/16S rRNA (cytidine1409-2'-O)-methyltransferase